MLANMPRIVIVMAKEQQIKSYNAIEGKKMKDNLTNSEEGQNGKEDKWKENNNREELVEINHIKYNYIKKKKPQHSKK